MGAGLIDDLFVIFYPYHFVRAILSIPFCPMPFCPYTILSIPFCPYHFVRYHFVLEPDEEMMVKHLLCLLENVQLACMKNKKSFHTTISCHQYPGCFINNQGCLRYGQLNSVETIVALRLT